MIMVRGAEIGGPNGDIAADSMLTEARGISRTDYPDI